MLISSISLGRYCQKSLVKSEVFRKKIKRGHSHTGGYLEKEVCKPSAHPDAPSSKNWHSLRNSHESMFFTQYFMYNQISWNKTFFIFFLFLT